MPAKPNGPTKSYRVIRGGIQLTRMDPKRGRPASRLTVGEIVQLTDRKARALINKVELVEEKPKAVKKTEPAPVAAPPAASPKS